MLALHGVCVMLQTHAGGFIAFCVTWWPLVCVRHGDCHQVVRHCCDVSGLVSEYSDFTGCMLLSISFDHRIYCLRQPGTKHFQVGNGLQSSVLSYMSVV